MRKSTSEIGRFDARFELTPADQQLFQRGRDAHKEFIEVNGAPLSIPGAKSQLMSCTLGPIKLTSVAFDGYDSRALDLCECAFRSLVGTERSDILLVIERPPRIVLDDCEHTLVERLAGQIGARAGIQTVDPESSLGSTSVILRAAELANRRRIQLDEILGTTVNATAYPLNIGLKRDFAKGLEEIVTLLPDDINLLPLYSLMVRAINYSPHQVREIGEKIDSAAMEVGLVDEAGQVQTGTLYTREGLEAIIKQIPHMKDEIICFAAGFAAPSTPSVDTIQALLACFESWGDSFSATKIHKGTIAIADYVRRSACEGDWQALEYMKFIDRCLQQARVEATARCIYERILVPGQPNNVLYVAEKAIAPQFGKLLAQRLEVHPSDCTYL